MSAVDLAFKYIVQESANKDFQISKPYHMASVNGLAEAKEHLEAEYFIITAITFSITVAAALVIIRDNQNALIISTAATIETTGTHEIAHVVKAKNLRVTCLPATIPFTVHYQYTFYNKKASKQL